MRALACVAALLGGAGWIASAILGGAAVYWAGAALLALAVFVLGLQLTPRAPTWLQAIVGIGSVGLSGSVLATVRAELDAATVDVVAGAAVILLFGFLAVRWRSEAGEARDESRHGRTGPRSRGTRGAHSA
ncbi:hypothetical protein [Nocardioides donggukensis]|uniref:Uncharacterized protein n=1 Tax=Nocardioides donggukensis TaxID=2774019 RepID=A0A927K616_9ACTN|nr:hypothetical protein [Nocardioides donggukensis]MBD8868360.1 hypothetical protein [Nocardioides donggukensis]